MKMQKILAWPRKISKRAKVVSEVVVSGRICCWPLVFCPLRGVGHVGGWQEWTSGAERRGKDELDTGARADRVVGGWPYEKVVACLVARSSLHPTACNTANVPDAASIDVRGRFRFIIYSSFSSQHIAMSDMGHWGLGAQ